ncbi:MAG TPA: hypothetical protein VGL94_18070 [Ktedonobacteraceae bacterium]
MESNPQRPSQSVSNQGQYASPPNQGYPPSAQSYPQMPPNQSYQQAPPLPNQASMPDPQRAGLRGALSRSKGLRLLLLGIVLVIGSIVFSVISYSFAIFAVNSGGTGYYTIFMGAVVVGAICAIIGFFRWILGR